MTLDVDLLRRLSIQQAKIVAVIKNANGGVVSSREIINRMYEDDPDGGPERPLDVLHKQIHCIRRELGDVIENVRRHGYRWKS